MGGGALLPPAPPMMPRGMPGLPSSGIPGMSGAPGGPGGLGRTPMQDRFQMGDPAPRQAPSTRGDPLKKMHSPQSPNPAKPPSSGPGKSPGGKPPSNSPGGGAGSGAPSVSHAQAMQFIAMTIADLGLTNAPMQVPPMETPPPQRPPQAPARPAGPPSSASSPQSPGVQMGGLSDDGLFRESESDWGNHPYLGDPSIARRRGQMFSRLRLR